MALTTPRRTSLGRVAAAGLAATASLALLGAASPAATAALRVGTAHSGASAVVGKDGYGKWVATGPARYKCRVYVAVSAGGTANGAASGECKVRMSQVVVVGISINNNQIKHTTARGTAKKVYTKALKETNPRGKQNICAFAYVNSPLDESNPVRSEAKVCVKA
ncbi:hypothetical protein ACWCRD_13980 [Streptomyces sp. NPDC002092]